MPETHRIASRDIYLLSIDRSILNITFQFTAQGTSSSIVLAISIVEARSLPGSGIEHSVLQWKTLHLIDLQTLLFTQA